MGTWDDFYLHINGAKRELIHPPNTKYFYSNAGFALLSQIIEKVSNMSYEEYMREVPGLIPFSKRHKR